MFARAVSAIFFEQFLSGVLERLDEFVADDFAFPLGIGHAFEQLEKALGGIDVFEFHVEILAEDALHHFCLTRAQQAVVDEDAGELVADRLVQQRGRDGRIDAAAQAEHDLLIADLLADARRRSAR